MTDYYSTGGGTQFERYRSRYREQINTVLYSCISSLDARMMYSCSKADGMVVHSCRDSVECERDEEIDDYVMSTAVCGLMMRVRAFQAKRVRSLRLIR